ncbi:MAG: thioredoxin-disulfide reductase [Endomicrobium sp.]|jgi:thioredoxin reductase (NADPH)|nr:thioredoxin-disulfide reductase [Endomicrobium sp.]
MIYDVVIIGGGPSGLSAAIYASRAMLKTLLIEKKVCGGMMLATDRIDNYPGFNNGISGYELSTRFEKQARKFNVKLIYDEVISVEFNSFPKKVVTNDLTYEATTVIIATGMSFKKMNVPGESKFIGKCISFCAVCDAPFYKDKNVLVVGGGDSAVQEAIYLSKFAKKVTIIYRKKKLRAMKFLLEKMTLCKNISILYNSVIREIIGKDIIEKIMIDNLKNNKSEYLYADAIFVFIGLIPNTSFIFNSNILDEERHIVTTDDMSTSIPGIFSCGDVRKSKSKQIVIATSDGAQAAISAQNYIENKI